MNLPFNLPERDAQESEPHGPVTYLDGTPLQRPAFLPRKLAPVVGVFVVAAAVVGFFAFTFVNDNVLNAPAKAKASIEENLSRSVSIDLPDLGALMALDDAAVQQTFADAGYSTIITSKEGDYPLGGFDLVKLPSDVDKVEAGLMYAEGLSKLSSPDMAKLLNGSWNFTCDRTQGLTMRVGYADFTSGSLQGAIQAAIVSQGLEGAVMGESGIDGAGNTYQAGTVDVDGTTYTWRVSVLPLSEMYKVDGFPESAVYVGIRFTA